MSSEELTFFEQGQLLLFDKPLYWTSHDLVNKVRIMIRSSFHLKKIKVGHAGTLDPLATGLMIICTGRSTKRIDEFKDLDKEYVATIHLGETTPSGDLETEVSATLPAQHITYEILMEAAMGFTGERLQIPPLHSAKLINGKRAYEFARKGIEKKLDPVKIIYREIEIVSFNNPDAVIRIVCSKGTYIRSFARDIGEVLGCGAYLSKLERKAIGTFKLSEAYSIEKFSEYLEQLQQNPI